MKLSNLKAKNNKRLIALFLVAIMLRLFFVLVYPQYSIESDAIYYDEIGWNIARGEGFVYNSGTPEVYWAPGYPLFLGAIYFIFGYSYLAVKSIQVVLSTLTVFFIFCISEKLFSRKVALISSFLAAVYPAFIGYTGQLSTETLYIFLISAAVYYFVLNYNRNKRYWPLVLGLIIGLSSLVRAETILLPLILFIPLLAFKKEKKPFLKKMTIVIIIMLIIISPWTLRNYLQYDKFIPLTVHDKDTLWISSYKEEWLEWHFDREPYKSLVVNLSEIERADVLGKEGIKNIRENPLLYIKFSIKRSVRFWVGGQSNLFLGLDGRTADYLYQGNYFKAMVKISFLLFNSLLVLLGFIGAYLSAKKFREDRKKIILIYSVLFIIVYKWAVHSFTFATVRYSTHIMPFLIVFSSFSLIYLCGYIKKVKKDASIKYY